jgi:hypothetical protein
MKTRLPRLTALELDAVISAAGNVDICMFDEDPDATEAEKDTMLAAYHTGLEKLRVMLAAHHAKAVANNQLIAEPNNR